MTPDRLTAGAVCEPGSSWIQYEIQKTKRLDVVGLIIWVRPVPRDNFIDPKGNPYPCECDPVLAISPSSLKVLAGYGIRPTRPHHVYTCFCQGRLIE